MTQYSYWSQAELDALHALYPKQGALAVAKLVRGRTIRSIRTKAMKLGISTLARKPQSPPPGWDDLAARIVLRVSRSEGECRNGHKYTPENTANYTHSRSLVCRECQRKIARKRRGAS